MAFLVKPRNEKNLSNLPILTVLLALHDCVDLSACRTVLELGSGVGLTGIVVCRSSSPTKYIFSDCHPTVLQRLRDNVTNCVTNCPQNSVPVFVEQLDWQNMSDEQLQRIHADTIIAAGDV